MSSLPSVEGTEPVCAVTWDVLKFLGPEVAEHLPPQYQALHAQEDPPFLPYPEAFEHGRRARIAFALHAALVERALQLLNLHALVAWDDDKLDTVLLSLQQYVRGTWIQMYVGTMTGPAMADNGSLERMQILDHQLSHLREWMDHKGDAVHWLSTARFLREQCPLSVEIVAACAYEVLEEEHKEFDAEGQRAIFTRKNA